MRLGAFFGIIGGMSRTDREKGRGASFFGLPVESGWNGYERFLDELFDYWQQLSLGDTPVEFVEVDNLADRVRPRGSLVPTVPDKYCGTDEDGIKGPLFNLRALAG